MRDWNKTTDEDYPELRDLWPLTKGERRLAELDRARAARNEEQDRQMKAEFAKSRPQHDSAEGHYGIDLQTVLSALVLTLMAIAVGIILVGAGG